MRDIIYKGYVIELVRSDFHPRKDQDNLGVLMLEGSFNQCSDVSEQPKDIIFFSRVYASSSGHLNLVGGTRVGSVFITKETQENTGVSPENFVKSIDLELAQLNNYIHQENYEALVYKVPEKHMVETIDAFDGAIFSAKEFIDKLVKENA